MAVYISLRDFEGPLDLLLHLVSHAKVDIKDIFVSEITEQYLEAMRGLEELDMDTASEFLTIAAMLLEMKSRALLPRPPGPKQDGEETPEQALIRRLGEYRLYKQSAVLMKEFECTAMQTFSKLPEEYPLPPIQVELMGLSLSGLVRALKRVLARQTIMEEPGRIFHSITRERFSIERCVFHLTARLRKGPTLLGDLLSAQPTREEIVAYFLAMLELLKFGKLTARQDKTYGDILMMPADNLSHGEDEYDGVDGYGA